ncbi:MAG: Fic family protein [Candidatus Dadabacteria bacterium]|nr:Fic family protein [Candidatus Dadabacteria bacterium]
MSETSAIKLQNDKRIEELFQEWKASKVMSNFLRNNDYWNKLEEKTRLEWNYNSNRMEGNNLTYDETVALILEDREEGGRSERDYMEMKAHDLAIEKVREFAVNRKLTEADIRSLNRTILKKKFWKEAETPDGKKTRKEIIPGQYKKQPNHVRTETGEIFKFAEPAEVAPKMQELVEWFNTEIQNPALKIPSFLAELHHRFILIHPFDDGNGRIARLWMNYALVRLGYPPMVIRSEDKENYFAALQKADGGDMDALAVYLGNTLIEWLEIGVRLAKGEKVRKPGDLDKEISSFIERKRAKGLEEIKQLSKEVINELYESLYVPLFEILESRFEAFDELFSSKEISFEIGGVKGETDWREELQKYVENWNINANNTVRLQIVYSEYRGTKPFDMDVELSISTHQSQYEVRISPRVRSWLDGSFSERKIYSHVLTRLEIENLIERGRRHFFNQLKREADSAER